MKNDPLLFCTWLQGYFELTDDGLPLTNTQVEIIKDHLALVFTKVTPNRIKGGKFEDVIEELGIDLEEVIKDLYELENESIPDVPTPTGHLTDEIDKSLEEIVKEWNEKNKKDNTWINPIPQWPQNPTQPFWEVDKKTYNPDWPTYPEIICSDKARLDIPDFDIEAPRFDTVTESFKPTSIKDIVKNKTFC